MTYLIHCLLHVAMGTSYEYVSSDSKLIYWYHFTLSWIDPSRSRCHNKKNHDNIVSHKTAMIYMLDCILYHCGLSLNQLWFILLIIINTWWHHPLFGRNSPLRRARIVWIYSKYVQPEVLPLILAETHISLFWLAYLFHLRLIAFDNVWFIGSKKRTNADCLNNQFNRIHLIRDMRAYNKCNNQKVQKRWTLKTPTTNCCQQKALDLIVHLKIQVKLAKTLMKK